MDRLSEQLAIVATIDPTASTTGTSTSDVVDMSDLHEAVFILSAGNIAATGTVDMDIQEGTGTATFNTATALQSITQLTAGDDNEQVVVSVPGASVTPGYRYLRAIVTQGTAGSIVSLVVLGDRARYKPPTTEHPDLASVTQIINV